MADRTLKGSILFEILIVLLAVLLIIVILIPDKIWKQEEKISSQCRYNLNSIYETERYYFRNTESYTDTLSQIVNFVRNDSSLQRKKQIVDLTNELSFVLNGFLNITVIQQILTTSQAIREVQGDLDVNERYFRKYEDILSIKVDLQQELGRFNSSVQFPYFSEVKTFIDSLNLIQEEISDYQLQTAALHSQRFMDSILIFLPRMEKDRVLEYWQGRFTKMQNLTNRINATDIPTVSSVGDRLSKFADRINTAMASLMQSDLQQNVSMAQDWQERFETTYQKLLDSQNFVVSQRRGLQSLSETDSILLTFNQNQFVCPDNGEQYLLAISGNNITVECPNLLDQFQGELLEAIKPIQNSTLFTGITQLDSAIDTTINLINEERIHFRRNTDILLNLKELIAEMQDLTSVRIYRFARGVQIFVDTVQTEKKISVLQPMIEDILIPMDSLAARIEQKRFTTLRERLEYYGNKVQQLDSLISTVRLPRNVQVTKYYPHYQQVFSILDRLEANLDPADADKFRNASDEIEKALLDVLDGYNERMYVIFFKKHINHGYIKDGLRSWED